MRINKRQMIEHSRIKVKNGKTLSRRIRAQLDKEWSKLGFEDWHRLNLSEQFAKIDEYHVLFLNLNNNNYPSILKDIENVSFPCLMKLHLHDNFIETIEGISRISIPSLQQFNIDSNRLIRITELRKGYFPQLQFLSLFNNLNASMELTSLTQTSAPLNQILLEVPQTQPYRGLAWISKLFSPKLSCVCIILQYLSGFKQQKNQKNQNLSGFEDEVFFIVDGNSSLIQLNKQFVFDRKVILNIIMNQFLVKQVSLRWKVSFDKSLYSTNFKKLTQSILYQFQKLVILNCLSKKNNIALFPLKHLNLAKQSAFQTLIKFLFTKNQYRFLQNMLFC